MSINNIRIATRNSALALWQTEFLKKKLQEIYPNLKIEVLGIQTTGDKILDIPLHKTGGKGLFVKELESALLNNVADIALHSMKDVPASMPEELEITAILEREDSRDAFVSNQYHHFLALPPKASIGTSSLRRQAQLAALRPDLSYGYLRGNVDTRIQKLDQNEYDAIILAVAGLKRLNLATRITCILEPETMLPCVGQGALGIQCRSQDIEIKKMLAALHHFPTALCVMAERSLNKELGGSCQLPVGGLAILSSDTKELILTGMVGSPDGSRIIKSRAKAIISAISASATTSLANPMDQEFGQRVVLDSRLAEELGNRVAKQLLEKGAKEIINACL